MLKPFEKLQFSQSDTVSRRADLLNKLGGALSGLFGQILGIIGEATAVPVTGTTTLDFGSTPAETASVVLTGQPWVTSASKLRAWFMSEKTTDNSIDEHEEAASMCPLVCGAIVPKTGFTIFAHPIAAVGLGKFAVKWEGVP